MRVAEGLPRGGARDGSYDLILANILADPLVTLAPNVARALAPSGIAVLSGLLVRQAERVIAAYRSRGFSVVDHQRLSGWSTLTLLKDRRAAGRPAGPPTRGA